MKKESSHKIKDIWSKSTIDGFRDYYQVIKVTNTQIVLAQILREKHKIEKEGGKNGWTKTTYHPLLNAFTGKDGVRFSVKNYDEKYSIQRDGYFYRKLGKNELKSYSNYPR